MLLRILPLAGNQQVQISVFQIEALAEIEISERSFEKIDATAQMDLVPNQVFKTSFFTCFEQQAASVHC